MDVNKIVAAMRADGVPAGSSGRWTVKKGKINPGASTFSLERGMFVPVGSYTWLHCLTMETQMNPPGETVMNDFPCELRKHLQFIKRARGRVLITGLGLGCVVRGLLARGLAESIDVIERSDHVLRLCADSVQDPRVTIHQRDALKGFIKGEWDYAWHDIWNDPDKNDKALQLLHAKLITKLIRRVKWQGAWAMPRWFCKRLAVAGLIPGRCLTD